MKIRVTGDGHNVRISIPTALLCNRLTAQIAVWGMRKAEVEAPITREQIARLLSEIRRLRKTRGAWELVSVESSDGDTVRIEI